MRISVAVWRGAVICLCVGDGGYFATRPQGSSSRIVSLAFVWASLPDGPERVVTKPKSRRCALHVVPYCRLSLVADGNLPSDNAYPSPQVSAHLATASSSCLANSALKVELLPWHNGLTGPGYCLCVCLTSLAENLQSCHCCFYFLRIAFIFFMSLLVAYVHNASLA